MRQNRVDSMMSQKMM